MEDPHARGPAVYTLRWEVELLFRDLKTQLRIEDLPTGNKAVAESLIYAALLALALGRSVHRVLFTSAQKPYWAASSGAKPKKTAGLPTAK